MTNKTYIPENHLGKCSHEAWTNDHNFKRNIFGEQIKIHHIWSVTSMILQQKSQMWLFCWWAMQTIQFFRII